MQQVYRALNGAIWAAYAWAEPCWGTAASPLTFSQIEEETETEMRCVRAHRIFSASRRVDLRCDKEVGAGCVLTGISGGWIWMLIINVEVWQALHFRQLLVNNQTEADTHLSDPRAIGVHSQTFSVRHQQLSVSLLSGCCVLFTVCLEETWTKEAANLKCGGPELLLLGRATGAFECGVCV